MASLRLRLLPSSFVCLVVTSFSYADLPYIPSTVLQTSHAGAPTIYSLDPPSPSSPHGSLRALTASSSLDLRSLPYKTLSNTAPFLQDRLDIAYTASIDENGSIYVVAGSCSAGGEGSSLWQFVPDPSSSVGNGTWSNHSITANGSGSPAGAGANYLSSSIAFSATVQSNAAIYTFGGMCPMAGSNASDWTSTALYSQQVIILQQDSSSQYDFELGTSKGQPIAEAGFSMTPLYPTFSNGTSGTQLRQQDFLLLGGHTQNAFINMSQVAIFSLPQTSWSFLPVTSDTIPPSVEPRSGHTAVLTQDGSKVVVFGGWVGDVTSPAEPQVAVLNVGVGYGGSQSWSWSNSSAAPPPIGEGVYGHGAVMLPGDVMMVSGGYNIQNPGSRRKKRAAEQLNTQSLFFNVTSNQWIDLYEPPPTSQAEPQGSSSGLLRTQPQKVGLGVGLTLGLLAVALAVLIGWLITRRYGQERLAKEQELREKEIDDLDALSRPYQDDGLWMSGVNGQKSIDNRQGVWKDSGVRDAERTGMDLDVPSPHRGLRRSMHARSRFDERRWSRGSGVIHPIEEGNEEDEIRPVSADDPFKDPDPDPLAETLRRVPTHLANERASPAEQRNQEMQGWVHEWARKNSLLAGGRSSPEQSDRTQSNLSEYSAVSHLSSHHSSSEEGAIETQDTRRGHSRLRLVPTFNNPFTGTGSAPSSPIYVRNTSPTRLLPPRSAGADSFQTAHSNMPDLCAESEALLGSTVQTPTQPLSASDYQRLCSPEPDADSEEPTFTRRTGPVRQVPTTKVGSWVGSVRRAINTASRSASMTSTSVRVAGALGGIVGHEPSSTASSPTKERTRGLGMAAGIEHSTGIHKGERHRDASPSISQPVRRSASDGANLLFSSARRGALDWDMQPDDARRTSSMANEQRPGWEVAQRQVVDVNRAGLRPHQGEARTAEEGEDWDVEAAVRDRNVQVMFTVPRERLRVVNADVNDGGSMRSVETREG